MFETKNSLSPSARGQAVALLNTLLASALDLQIRAKSAHWNVKGPLFTSLHAQFDKVFEYAVDAADDLAERAAALGGVVEAAAALAAERSLLPALPAPAPVQGLDHVRTLSESLAIFANAARAAIERSLEFGDQATADLFIDLARQGDKQLWFLEAHIQ